MGLVEKKFEMLEKNSAWFVVVRGFQKVVCGLSSELKDLVSGC